MSDKALIQILASGNIFNFGEIISNSHLKRHELFVLLYRKQYQ